MIDNHIGETVGVFTIVELMPNKDADGHALYKGTCNECGLKRIARYGDLKRTSKCTHVGVGGVVLCDKTNWKNSRIKSIFYGMKQRCYNDKTKSYRWYGGRGIKICDEWLNNPKDFEEWALNNGYNNTLTIDRIDENEDYCPGNCRWADSENNSKYKSTTSLIDVNGEKHTGRDWAQILGIGINTINKYIRKYGPDNTSEFIRRYMANPTLKPSNKNKSIYGLYMN